MKIKSFFLLFLILGFFKLSAQNTTLNKPAIDTIAHRNAQSLKKPLNLNDQQVQKIYLVEKEYLIKRSGFSNTMAPDARKSEIQKMDKQREDELKSILTQQQFRLYQQHIEDRKRLMDDKKKPTGGGG